MQTTMIKKIWEKVVVIEGREFRIKFWYDNWDFFYTRIEEKIKAKPTRFNKKDYCYKPICNDYWIIETEENPIEVALNKIKESLNIEKKLKTLENLLDKFCQ